MRKHSRKQLLSVFSYDSETGVFRWRKDRPKAKAGTVAGCRGARGYWHITLEGGSYKGNVLAWLFIYGYWPARDVDHKNRIRDDNRICNLQLATRSQNSAGAVVRKDNTSGVKGVCWLTMRNKWRAAITKNGRTFNLGHFVDKEEATFVYQKKAEEFFGHFAKLSLNA